MKRFVFFIAIMLVVFFVTPGKVSAVSVEEVQKITEAAPAKATVEPKQPRKVLLFTLCKGYKHSSIPYCTKAFEILGEKTGAFTTVVSDDMTIFRPDSLKQFDAVCFNNTTHLNFDDEPGLRESLMNFVKSGKGIIGIHAATDNFFEWPEAAEMMGGTFDGHPWGSNGTWAVRIEDPAHPVALAFKGKGFKVNDEIYRTKTINLRENARVLFGLDLTDKVTGSAKGMRPEDVDIAISWVRDFGKGRVFYSSLGHNHHIYWTPAILQHYLDGIQFALGDLEADTTPLPFRKMLSVNIAAVNDMLKNISSYEFGQSRKALVEFDNLLANYYDSPEDLAKIERSMIKTLQSEATLAAKDFICRKLSVIGTPGVAPALAVMLADPETADMARYVLERIQGRSVDQILLMVLSQASGNEKIGIINTLGQRRSVDAVSSIAPFANSDDSKLAFASIAALGEIATPDAIKTIEKVTKKSKGHLHLVAMDAYLKCADALVAEGDSKTAMKIYSVSFSSDEPTSIRIAALTGMVVAAPEKAIDTIIKVLKTDDLAMQASAIALVRTIRDNKAIDVLIKQLPELSPAGQTQMLGALADVGNRRALSAVVKLVGSSNDSVRIAAIQAVSVIGDESVVDLLAETAATSSGSVQSAARQSLYTLSDRNVNGRIVSGVLAKNTKSAKKIELIKAVDQRRITSGVDALLTNVKNTDVNVSIESLKVLRSVNNGDIAPIVPILLNAKSASHRREVQRTIVAIATSASDKAAPVKVLLNAIPSVDNSDTKAAIISVLGKIGEDAALPAIRDALAKGDDKIKDEAVRALAGWPNVASMPDLLNVAANDSKTTRKAIAIRGYVKLAALPSKRSNEETVKMLADAMKLAPTSAEKKAILSVLPKFPCKAAIELANAAATDKEIAAEAKLAATKIKAALFTVNIKASASHNGGNVSKAFDKNMKTRWDTGSMMKPGNWFSIDLSSQYTVKGLALDTTGSKNDYPRGYEVYASSDGKNWGKAIVKGSGDKAVTNIEFDSPVSSRHFKIVQTGSSDKNYWSIHEIMIDLQ